MKIQFIGATHEVTGSCTLLEVNGKYYLVDCGMEQGRDVFENIEIPVPPATIEAVFITHAHMDHTGMLPKLCKDGFRGSVYATDVTTDLCSIMLRDSANIQEMEASWKSRKSQRAGGEKIEPLYTSEDVTYTMTRFRRCLYGETVRVSEEVEVRFTDVGHLLGSASIELWLTERGITEKIVFSGDVGNKNQRIICDPKPTASADYLVIESTYGDRLHKGSEGAGESADAVAELAKCLQRTFDRGGSVIIPAFAVGRTQEMLYALREIKTNGMVTGHDHFPVYVDSPLASEATSIFLQCNPVCFDRETLALIDQGINPIWTDDIIMTETADESKLINANRTPKVILSSSGMCEAGRIRHHLKHNLWKAENTVLFVGYQSEGTLGRRLLNGEKTVTLFGEEVSVLAEIASLSGTSGHADQKGLLDWLDGFNEKPKLVFVNHGDNDACETFRDLLNTKGLKAYAPYSGSEFDLLTGNMTVFAEGKTVKKPAGTKSADRMDRIYQSMVAAAEQLLHLVQGRKGRANKDNAKLTSQIRDLISKWLD